MRLDRRVLLTAAPALVATSAFGKVSAPPALAAYEQETGGRIGLFAANLVTGARIVWRADERFVMCSTFKASLAGLALSRVDQGRERLDRRIRFGPADILDYAPIAKERLAKAGGAHAEMTVAEVCAAAVSYSDNTCANLLLASVGGPAALTAFWRRLGDPTSRLDHNEPVLNRSPPGDPHDTTTPAAMAGNLRKLLLGRELSDGSQAKLIGWMVDCQTGANRLRGGLPKAWRVADKTGNNGKDASGDITLAWPAPNRPILICAYAQGGSPSPERIERLFAEIGRMVGEQLA